LYLTRDPELRTVGAKGTAVVNFGIAVSRQFKKNTGETAKETTFLEFEAWDSGAETINRHFKKGDPIIVHCSAKTEQWEDKTSGQKRSRIKFRVNKFEWPLSKPRQSNQNDDGGVDSGNGDGGGEDFTPNTPASGEDIPF
jgi:single-strand DNA-binding protein